MSSGPSGPVFALYGVLIREGVHLAQFNWPLQVKPLLTECVWVDSKEGPHKLSS